MDTGVASPPIGVGNKRHAHFFPLFKRNLFFTFSLTLSFFPFIFHIEKWIMAIFRVNPRDSFKKRLFISYGRDWILVVIMAIIFFAIDIIPPFHREFSINDTSIMHKYTENESVPVWLLMVVFICGGRVSKMRWYWCILYVQVVAILIPVLVIIAYSGFFRRNWLDFNSGLLGKKKV